MWFKNILIYRFTKLFDLNNEELINKLAEKPFEPCGSQDMHRHGWVSPLGAADAPLAHSANGFTMLCLQRQEKLLPAAVINEMTQVKVDEIQEQEGRKVARKERQNIRDEVTFTLMPRAFVKTGKTYAYIDHKQELLIINASSAKKAEYFCHALRETLGSLPVVPVTANNIPQQVMTDWMRDGVNPDGFELGTDVKLRDPSDEGGTINAKNQLLTSEEMYRHISYGGMYATEIELASAAGIECLVDEQLTIKRIRYGDMIQDKVEDAYTGDSAERFDVDFSIMTLELRGLISALLAAFGGENLDAVDAQ